MIRIQTRNSFPGVEPKIVALAAATFVRAFGITFLGRARSGQAAVAHETNRPQLIAMAVLAMAALRVNAA